MIRFLPSAALGIISSRARYEMVFKRFLPAVAGGWLLLVQCGVGMGGCLDDGCKFPSVGGLFKSHPVLHHHDGAASAVCPPCYGYHPTCWRPWPDSCAGCPPPPVPIPTESPTAPPTTPPIVPQPVLPPLPPQPETVPQPAGAAKRNGVPTPTKWSRSWLPGSETPTPPAPMTAPRQLRPADPVPLPPVAKPGPGSGVGRLRPLPDNLQATQLPVAPMPPDLPCLARCPLGSRE